MTRHMSPRRAIVLGIALLLLAAILGGVSRMMREKGATKDDANPANEREASLIEDNSAMRGAHDRPDPNGWRRTVESAAAGLTANEDAPVRIGFVQTSPDQRRWRVSLQRTPAAGEVLDAAKITIQVETLARPDDAETNSREDLAIEWETQGRSFEKAAAPRLKVTAEKPMLHLRFKVFYDGTEIERRTFSAEPAD